MIIQQNRPYVKDAPPPKKIIKNVTLPSFEVSYSKIPLSLSKEDVAHDITKLFQKNAVLVPQTANPKGNIGFVISYASSRLTDEVKSVKLNQHKKKYPRIVLLFVTTEGCDQAREYSRDLSFISVPDVEMGIVVFNPDDGHLDSKCDVNLKTLQSVEEFTKRK
ncbi:hypothetical protein AKO1_007923 [Acrasis kona]|uniref:Uncharacterized protein n=1 Tax=Acrasis kona TaxID=1008807 RepID=A0AAW2YPP8_9EUKA